MIKIKDFNIKLVRFFSVFLVLSILLTTLCCASSPRKFIDIDTAVQQADFNLAVRSLVKAQDEKRGIYSSGNSILLYLDKGILEHYAGNYAESSRDLQHAERLIEEAYTKSISQGFLSYIVNDNTKDYPGEDFEDIYLNVFNALNYYKRGDMEGALVEIRKLSMSSGKLDMLARKYEYTDPDTGASLNEIVQRETGITGDFPPTKTVNFSNSALARYLGALFYQGIRNTDAARIEFDQVHRAFATNTNVYRHPVPQAVEQARNVPSGKARLNIISFAGLSPVKEQVNTIVFLPFQNPMMRFATFKLPEMVRRPSAITRIEVIVDGKDKFELELLEDISAVIEETFNARYSNIMIKTFVRTILKYAAADVLSMETWRRQGDVLGVLAGVAARVGLEVSESADTRMSRYLPGKAYIGGINLDPGTYSVIINYCNRNNVIATDVYNEVVVNLNTLNLLESVNLK